MKIFKDRRAAGKLLAHRLEGSEADLVMGIPRGGVVVASEISDQLKLPLDIIVTRKIGSPNQPELALGAIDPDGEVVWEDNVVDHLDKVIKEEWKELKRREDLYRRGRKELEIKGKRVILVDDGIATGSTILAAIKYLNRHGVKVILAVPVASKEALDRIKGEVDEVVVLHTPDYFQAVGQFYEQFNSVLDEEVIQLLS